MATENSNLAHVDDFQGNDDGKQTTLYRCYLMHDPKWIEAIYTNEGTTVARVLNMYTNWLKKEQNKFIGLDLEYDVTRRKIAVMQFGLKDHILIFHKIRLFAFTYLASDTSQTYL
jgi:hypothetical protein